MENALLWTVGRTKQCFSLRTQHLIFKSYSDYFAQINPSSGKKKFNQKLWDDNIHDIAFRVLYQKFYEDSELIELLLNTKDAIIVEATRKDKIWGIGLDCGDPNIQDKNKWKGQNILGFTLMKVRDTLKEKQN